MNRFSSRAIILRKRDYSESDKIIVAFSQDKGKISFIAKGIKKLKSKKRGSIEVGNIVSISVTRPEGMGILTEALLLKSFDNTRKNLNKLSVMYYFCEVVDKLTQPEEPNPELFNLLLKYLSRLSQDNKLKQLRKKFIYDTLVLVGFWPKDRLMDNPDQILEDVLERRLSSERVGKKLMS